MCVGVGVGVVVCVGASCVRLSAKECVGILIAIKLVSQPESKTINWQGQTETIEIIEMEMTKNKKFN